MIDYEILVQTIADWRSGKRPTPLQAAPFATSLPSDAVRRPAPEESEYELAEAEMEDAEQFAREDETRAYVPYGYDPAERGEELEAGGGDPFFRDPAVEAVDDYAGFDVDSDLPRWFRAEQEVERAWGDPEERRIVFETYGIRDEPHFYQVRATLDRYLATPSAQDRWGGRDAMEQLRLEAIQQSSPHADIESFSGAGGPDLDPIENISLHDWAFVQAQLDHGAPFHEALGRLGIPEDVWSRVAQGWRDRMVSDDAGAIEAEYRKAYHAASDHGGATQEPEGDPPMEFERFVEIEQAVRLLVEAGHDANDILAEFSLSLEEWQGVSQWWGDYLVVHGAEDDQALLQRYHQLQEFYAGHYASVLSEE